MGTPKIGAEFVLDDKASATLDKVKSGFGEVLGKANGVASSLVDIGKTAFGTYIGLNFNSAIAAMSELGKSAVARAIDFQQAEKNAVFLAGSVAKAGTSFDELKGKATGFVQDMKKIEIQTGITGATLSESFAQIADKMNPARASITQAGTSILQPLNYIEKGLQRSEGQVKQLFSDIGNAGRLVAGGPDALAKSFANFSGTGAKASDPIVQMIAATGVLKGNAKQVAEQLHMLTDASAMSFAQAAIEKMAKKGRDIPPDFNQVVNQLNSIKDQFLKQFGQPILSAIVPAVERFKAVLEANAGKIEHFAKVMGVLVSKYVSEAAKKFEEGFKYIVNHADEIGKAIEKAMEFAKKTFDFILAHKEEIAAAYGASQAASLAPGAMALGKGIAGVKDVGAGAAGLAAGMPAMYAAVKAFGASAVGLGAFAAALGAATAVVYNFYKLMQENSYGGSFGAKGELMKEQDAIKETMKNMSKGGSAIIEDQYANLKKRYVANAKELGGEGAGKDASAYADNILQNNKSVMSLMKMADEGGKFLNAGGGTKLRKETDTPEGLDKLSDQYATNIVTLYNTAVAQNNTTAQKYAADIIAGSAHVQNAFVNSKAQLQGGFEGLATVLGEKGLEVTNKLKDLMDEASGKKGATPTKPVVQFNNNTFNLNQNFRDNDPDRIALIFRQDIIKAAEGRRQSRVGGAFGLLERGNENGRSRAVPVSRVFAWDSG